MLSFIQFQIFMLSKYQVLGVRFCCLFSVTYRNFVFSCLLFDSATVEKKDVNCVTICINCRSSLFNRFILIFTVAVIMSDNVYICFEIRFKLRNALNSKTCFVKCLNQGGCIEWNEMGFYSILGGNRVGLILFPIT